jgi:hypothetical protein
MVQVDGGAHFEHVKVIRCDIKPRSVERSRDCENGQFQKKSKKCYIIPSGLGFQTPLYILED